MDLGIAAVVAAIQIGGTIGASHHHPTHTATRCVAPKKSRVVARDSEAVVRIAGQRYGVLKIYACLRAQGRMRLLATEENDYGYEVTPQRFVVAGRFLAIWFTYIDKYQDCGSYLDVYNLPSARPVSHFDAGCTFIGSPIAAEIKSLSLDAEGFSAWKVTEPIQRYEPLTDVSCATSTFCVAVDGVGDVLTTTDPTAGRGAWTISQIESGYELGGVSCPATSLCLAYARFSPDVFTSTNPAGGAGAWSSAPVEQGEIASDFPRQFTGVSCPTVSFCVAVDDDGDVLTSTNPTGGAGAWSTTPVDPSAGHEDPSSLPSTVSCPAVSLCVATDDAGSLLTSTNPSGGAGAWTVSRLGGPALSGVSCPSASLCVAVAGGDVFTTTDPGGGAGTWTSAVVYDPGPDYLAGLIGISCPSVSLCVAIDNVGHVLTSTNPTGGAGAWSEANVEAGDAGFYGMAAVSCPSAALCVAVDDVGNVLTSTDPAAGANSWSRALVDAPSCVPATPCIAERLYEHDDHGTQLLDSAPPGTGQVIAQVRLSGTTLTWTHSGTARALRLG
jgi:hypothetical protein